MNCKNIFSLLTFVVAVVFFSSCGNSEIENFQVKGKLINSSGEFITLVNVNTAQKITIDSVQVNEQGDFTFTKKVPEKGFYSIQITTENFATLITDSTETVTLEGDAKDLGNTYKVSGSPDSEMFIQFNETTRKKFKKIDQISIQQDSIRRVFQAYLNTTRDSVQINALSKSLEPRFNALSIEYRKEADEVGAYVKDFIDKNSGSFVTLAAIQLLSTDRDITYFIKVADALIAKYPNIETTKEFKKYVDKEKKIAVGMPPPEIKMNDSTGNPLSLSSLKGKVVLLDFWASWCKPCRQENPFVVSLYNKYKDHGFEIFSVSLDQKKEAWRKAIEQDRLFWKNHVCDFKMWQSPVVEQYGFTGIPFACLIDKNGNVAGKNLRGPQLEAKIAELLGISATQ